MTRQTTPDLLGEPIPSEDPSLEAMLGSAQRIATVLIRLDGGTQPRAGIDQAMVDDYANDMANGAVFPPVELVYDGTDYWLWDGFHRFHAYRGDGDRAILANVRQGTRRDAVLLSVGANATHGLRRTNADKRRSVLALLEDEQWSLWSNGEIARRCAVSDHFVGVMRAELTPIRSESTVRRGADGRTINVENIGKTREEPKRLEIYEIETHVWRWLKAHLPAEKDQIQYLESFHKWENREPVVTWIKSEQSDNRPWRSRDLIQAGNNILEQLRQRTRQAEPKMVATVAIVEETPEPELVRSEISVPLVPWTKEREIGIVTIWKADSRNLTGETSIPPVDLVITSPPYNVGIEYSEHFDKLQQDQYIALLHNVFLGCHRVMKHGARIAVVVPFGIGRSPWQPMSLFVAAQIQAAGFQLRGQIIWDKGTTGNRTSWGSFRSPSDPSLRDTCECIIVAHKSQSQAAVPHLLKDEKGSYTAWLERSEYFMELAQDHWKVAPESAQRVGHPAPFPVELVRRLVHFYGWPGCTLLDPFGGSGTVGVAAVGLDCKAHLVDIDEAYCRLAERRIKAAYQGRNMLEETHAN